MDSDVSTSVSPETPENVIESDVVDSAPSSVRNSQKSENSRENSEKTEVVEEEFVKKYVCERKCVKKADQICYDDIDEDLELQRNGENEGGSNNSGVLGDSVRSGESLFKTFTFEANESSHDVEKCMAFWRTVLERNLKPLKCTLVEPKEPEIPEEPKAEIPVIKTVSQELRELSPIWGEAWKDIQRKRLDKVKLMMKKKCECCELLDSEKHDNKFENNEELLSEIKALNNWIPDKNPLFKASIVTESESSVEAPTPKSAEKDTTEAKSNLDNITFTTFSQDKLRADKMRSNERLAIKETCSSQIGPKPPENSAESLKGLDMCLCGCETSKCICDRLEAGDVTRCTCGCAIDKCMCERTPRVPVDCECICGLDDCVCLDYPEVIEAYCRCACGYDDCVCGEEASEEESSSLFRSTISIGVQCEDFGPKMQDETKGFYCIICGHFDCYCKVHD